MSRIHQFKNKSEFVHWKVIYILVVLLHRNAHSRRYSKRDDNGLTFVRFASCLMIWNDKDNANPFLRIERQFVDEFSDAFEVEVVGWRDGYLEKN